MIDKLINSHLWEPFKQWYSDQSKESTSIWIDLEIAIDLNPIFMSLVFLKFLEEYFECIMERMYGEGFGICYSLIDNTNYKPISFRGLSGFYTLEELILAAFEDE